MSDKAQNARNAFEACYKHPHNESFYLEREQDGSYKNIFTEDAWIAFNRGIVYASLESAEDAEKMRSFDVWRELITDEDNIKVVISSFVHTDACAAANFPNDINTENCLCGLASLLVSETPPPAAQEGGGV